MAKRMEEIEAARQSKEYCKRRCENISLVVSLKMKWKLFLHLKNMQSIARRHLKKKTSLLIAILLNWQTEQRAKMRQKIKKVAFKPQTTK